MKLCAGLIAASCGLAVAAQPAAQVYLVPAREASSSTPSLSPALARLVLLQRLAPRSQGPSLRDADEQADIAEAVSALNRFGKASPPLFADDDNGEPSQLVMMLDGMSEEQIKDLGRALGTRPAFTIPEPPSAKAHDELVKVDLVGTGATNAGDCDMQQVANPLEGCWKGRRAAFAKFDVNKNSDIVSKVVQRLDQLSKLAKIGELETTLVLLPPTANSRPWSDQPRELRRRQAEQVMTSLDKTARPVAPTSSVAENLILYAPGARIASCFASEDSCIKATGNCSEHGSCLDRYAGPDVKDAGTKCFACHCLSTRSEAGGLIHWAGPRCAKQDVSVAFWLFAGFTLALVGILWLSISMLFGIGQEKLPGVIGAGVSRAK
ncbi:arsenate reductase [Hirsutella rhossiliensis]|uniref:Arsenate reductase n=1 Tax=Hirsutella rhossiliensis TaxID=111463 RepID=A0A9P8N056_9HYPO|nr:arsenate reductase [Hirsutella rhossiliensis]KAH0962322.1 arsenate reductase [Hirsutella rhossiliensis]